jgi:LCP family protein required for cell wall assembly
VRTTVPVATFPEADPEAQNFLITGADNNACVDPDSPYFGVFGDREGMGERSDTIMVLRVDPDADRVAVLSFPRDLYVDISGSGRSRINSAYQRDDPQRLVETIYENFGVPIDHYIQVDFCAFKTLVDAVGGVAVPFEFPARDDNTGLNVPTTGCFVFDGEHALAYVRSRHYEYEDPAGSGNWQEDPSSDLGRISRQQDFIRRTLSSVLDEGPLDPRVARGLIRAATEYVVTDRDLTPARMLEFAGVMNDVDPASILTYQIEASDRTVNGAAVLQPNIDGDNMQAILSMFRGETSLADAPVQEFELTSTAAPRGATTTLATTTTVLPAGTVDGAATSPPTSTPTSTSTSTSTTVAPAVETTAPESTVAPEGPQENQVGIVPPRDVAC